MGGRTTNIPCPAMGPLHQLSVLHVNTAIDKHFQAGLLKETTKSLCVSAEAPEGWILVELVARRHFSRKLPLENELRLCLSITLLNLGERHPSLCFPQGIKWGSNSFSYWFFQAPSSERILAENSSWARQTWNLGEKEPFEMTCLPFPLGTQGKLKHRELRNSHSELVAGSCLVCRYCMRPLPPIL